MGGRQQQQRDRARGDAFQGGMRQLARLLAAAIEEDQVLVRSTKPSTEPQSSLLDTESSQHGASCKVPLSAIEANR